MAIYLPITYHIRQDPNKPSAIRNCSYTCKEVVSTGLVVRKGDHVHSRVGIIKSRAVHHLTDWVGTAEHIT